MPQTIDNMSVTWTNSLTTYTGIKLNAAGSSDANSAAGSLLMDLQVGGASRFSVSKAGAISSGASGASAAVLSATNFKIYSNSYFAVESGGGIAMTLERNAVTGLRVGSTMPIGWASTVDAWNNAPDLILGRRAAANLRLGAADTTGTTAPTAQTLSVQSWTSSTNNNQPGANFIIAGSQGTGTGAGGSIIFQVAPAGAVSNGVQNALVTFLEATSARAFNLYNTTDVTTNFERGKIAWSANVLQIGTEKAGTGTARALEFQTNGVTRLTIAATGPVNVSHTAGLVISNTGGNGFSTTGGGYIIFKSSGVLTLTDASDADFGRLQFGGTTSSFPALKRNSTALETKLADDSAYAPHAMQYLDVTDGITAPASATGRARIYVDTADGDLKVIFADGTVKTIVTDT